MRLWSVLANFSALGNFRANRTDLNSYLQLYNNVIDKKNYFVDCLDLQNERGFKSGWRVYPLLMSKEFGASIA